MFAEGQLLKVRENHRFFSNRIGKFEFMGGPDADVVVLSKLDNDRVIFVVGPEDVEVQE